MRLARFVIFILCLEILTEVSAQLKQGGCERVTVYHSRAHKHRLGKRRNTMVHQ